MTKTIIFELSDLAEVVKKHILPKLDHYKIFTLTGPLGVGKTTLIKEILQQCGVRSIITSPTFSYVNTYIDNGMRTLNHFDLYRIERTEEFISAGFDEILMQKNSINFVEWPELIDTLLNNPTIKPYVCSLILKYDQIDQNSRCLNIYP